MAHATTDHDDSTHTTLLADTEYWCQHCHRVFLGRDAVRDFFGNREGCPSPGCGACGLGLDVFAADDPWVTGECSDDAQGGYGGHDRPDADEWHLRDDLLGLETMTDVDAVARFEGLTLGRLASLLELRFLDVEAQRPGAPDVAAFMGFLCRWPEATLHGHALHPSRDDDGGAVRVEGVTCELDAMRDGRREALRGAFLAFAQGADVLIDGPERLVASWRRASHA
jgi:hypothetical protein